MSNECLIFCFLPFYQQNHIDNPTFCPLAIWKPSDIGGLPYWLVDMLVGIQVIEFMMKLVAVLCKDCHYAGEPY